MTVPTRIADYHRAKNRAWELYAEAIFKERERLKREGKQWQPMSPREAFLAGWDGHSEWVALGESEASE